MKLPDSIRVGLFVAILEAYNERREGCGLGRVFPFIFKKSDLHGKIFS